MSEVVNLSRRGFLKAGALAGGGLVLGVYLPGPGAAAQEKASSFMPNAFVRIGKCCRPWHGRCRHRWDLASS